MIKQPAILIIDDDRFITASLCEFLTGKGHEVFAAETGQDGLRVFEEHHPAIVLLDQKLPDISGVEVCRRLLEINPTAKVIFITAHATVRYAVDAMQAGAFNYLAKPFSVNELLIAVGVAAKNVRLEGRLRIQEYERRQIQYSNRLIGSSDIIKRLKEQIKIFAGSDSAVLITGETGVGKNVVAKAIHDHQNRRESFLSINCAAIPENLIEAEYFGHEKGVFTGADSRREGIFELADGGTLVLDEIGELPIHLQSKLLAVLEEKRVRRIGGNRMIPVDVRIMATTNQDLEAAIGSKTFREDLYYRLAVINIRIPPLRQHPEDIPELSHHFVKMLCNRPIIIPQSHLKRMMTYPWPGNVRELKNIIERASLLRTDNTIRPADLLLEGPDDGSSNAASGFGQAPHQSDNPLYPLERVINEHVQAVLNQNAGNKSRTAKSLGISLSTLKRRLQRMKK
jgi:DNA-binding NtrC family response regulator